MKWQNQNVFPLLIITAGGGFTGLFVYSPGPGAGNLVDSIAPAAGTDPYGNSYQQGITSYLGSFFASLQAGQLVESAATWFRGAVVGVSSNSVLALNSPQVVNPDLPMFLELFSGSSTGGPNMKLGAGSNFSEFLAPSGDTTGATDTANVAAAYSFGITDLVCLPGQFWGTPVVPANCSFRGSGPGTQWNLPATSGTLTNMITNAANAQVCRISDMTLDGNNTHQGAGAWQAGIVLNNPPADGRHVVRNVRIQNFTGDGLVQLNRGSSQFSDIQIFGCNGFGVNAHEDCYYSNVDVGACGLDGFLIQGGSNRFSNCKAFFSGAALVSSRIAGATLLTVTPPAQAFDGGSLTGGFTFSLASGFGSGFHYANIGGSGTTPAINASGGEIAACCGQDNARNGFLLNSRRMALTAIDADSNNNCGTTGGGVPNGTFAGVEITGNRNNVQGVSWNRAANVNSQAAALEIVAALGQATLNRVDLGFDGTLNDGSNMPPMTAASTFYDNGLTFRPMGGRGFEPHAFTASFTPDPFAAETFQMPITANITINAPALAGTNTTGIFLIPGMLIRIILVEDIVGGHTVTFAAGAGGFAGASAANTAAARTNVWTFVFDNQSGNWLECSFQNF